MTAGALSDAETTRPYPCDEFVPAPTLQAWRGVSVAAPAAAVWPWVAQIRLAPYSYDWVDNFGRRSPQELVGLPEPQVGDTFTATGGRRLGRILSVDPGVQLTGSVLGAVMSYVLAPQGAKRPVCCSRSSWAAPARSHRWCRSATS